MTFFSMTVTKIFNHMRPTDKCYISVTFYFRKQSFKNTACKHSWCVKKYTFDWCNRNRNILCQMDLKSLWYFEGFQRLGKRKRSDVFLNDFLHLIFRIVKIERKYNLHFYKSSFLILYMDISVFPFFLT